MPRTMIKRGTKEWDSALKTPVWKKWTLAKECWERANSDEVISATKRYVRAQLFRRTDGKLVLECSASYFYVEDK